MLKERAVFLTAQDEFIEWLNALPNWPKPPDRRAITALGSAVKSLQKALQPFGDDFGGNRMMLLALMQSGRAPEPSDTYVQALESLGDTLRLVADAASAAGPSSGVIPAQRERVWVLMAGKEWAKTVETKPSAAPRGRFWLALEQFQQDKQAWSEKLPVVSRDTVARTLKKALQSAAF